MGKVIEVTCPHCEQVFQVELPEKQRKPHGQLAGIAIEDMTDEQLKREIVNANSVLYKAQKRNASEETLTKAQARLDAAKALRDERKANEVEETEADVEVETEAPAEATTEEAAADESVYAE